MSITILDQTDKKELEKKIDDTKTETEKQIDEAIANATGPIDPSRIKDMYYEEDGMIEILPETTVTIGSAQNVQLQIEFNTPLGLVVGGTYIVNHNGVNYECIGVDISDLMGMPCVALGNLAILGKEDTGEPFCCVDSSVEIDEGIYGSLADLVENTTMTASIKQTKVTIHQIPPKYIKDMYYEETKETVIYPETTLEFAVQEDLGDLYCAFAIDGYNPLTKGVTYIVTWNGVEYSCACPDGGLGDVDGTGTIPFTIADFGTCYIVMPSDQTATSATFSIRGPVTTVKQIDAKYISDDTFTPPLVDLTSHGTVEVGGGFGNSGAENEGFAEWINRGVLRVRVKATLSYASVNGSISEATEGEYEVYVTAGDAIYEDGEMVGRVYAGFIGMNHVLFVQLKRFSCAARLKALVFAD